MADELSEKYTDNAPGWLYRLDREIHRFLPVIIVILLVYLTVYFGSNIDHPILKIIEGTIAGYFILEVGVAYILYEDRIAFLKDKWINILLILPFLTVFKAAGRLGAVLELSRSAEIMNTALIAESSTVARISQQTPKIQKMGHGIIDLPKIIKKSKRFLPYIGVLAVLTKVFKSENSNPNDNKNKED